MIRDGKEFGKELVTIVKGYVERALASRDDRLSALEERLAALDGKKADKPRVRVKAGGAS
jgi:hypothetical protein